MSGITNSVTAFIIRLFCNLQRAPALSRALVRAESPSTACTCLQDDAGAGPAGEPDVCVDSSQSSVLSDILGTCAMD